MGTIAGKTIVITGASSGLGRAVAVQLAEQGAKVVLAARREDALEQTAKHCRQVGGFATTCVTDVTVETDVQRLLQHALELDGQIDVWINNAGVTLFGHLDEGPFAEHRRVIETNVFGSMLGARAVLPLFRRQGHGILVNVGSALSKVGQPFVPSYVISKFAIHGLSEALRVDVAEFPNIHVCSFLPYAFDSQHFESGANYIGKPAHAMQPVQTPNAAARALVGLIKRPQRELHFPRWIAAGYLVHALLPRLTERLLLRMLDQFHFENAPQQITSGALFDSRGRRAALVGSRPPLVNRKTLVWWAAKEAAIIGVDLAIRRASNVGGRVAQLSLLETARLLRWLARGRQTHQRV